MSNPAQTLHTLARLDPDFPAFTATLPPELTEISGPLPDGLAADALAWLLQERPELNAWVAAQETAPPNRMALDPLTTAGVVTAITFLLRAHIKIKRDNDGKWSFSFEVKPLDGETLNKILDGLFPFLNGKPTL